ncbi:SACS [Mytilus edulis]|uniref:SACS n=1 Tax=Mytilus edulis TaxID=6550 RepID=A0A8S3SV05_MYTED|nr:SACS [Mytilus edulis]
MEEEEIEPECTGMKRTTLIEELTKILRDYPDDGQILKEMIQNAEDAGAVRIAIVYDERQLPSNPYSQRYTYSSPYSKYFQGPALIVYNNEEFSEDDWEGILRIGTSIKNLIHQQLVDLDWDLSPFFISLITPMIISGHQMMILNPYLDEDKCCIPLRLSKLRLYRGFCLQECFEALGPAFNFVENVTKNGYFKGTMFRKRSIIFYGCSKKRLPNTDIFNSIEEICLYERLGSLFEQNPDYMVTIGGCSNDEARKDRRVNKPKYIPNNSLTKMYLLKLETSGKRQPIKQTVWLVLNRLVGISEGSKTLLRLSKKLAYLPCIGIAVPMSPNTNEHQETLIYTMRQYNCCLIETQGFQRLDNILCKAYGTPPQDASPQFISERLLKWNSVYRKFEREDKLNILTYLISNEEFDLLKSLELLPLSNGAFTMFRTSNYPKVFVCSISVRQLCPGMEESLVHQLPSKMNEQILKLAKSGD